MSISIYNSVEQFTVNNAVAFVTDYSAVFREQGELSPVSIGDTGHKYMPWGADNDMPYRLLDSIEEDETLSTCQMFNAEVCYGAGLHFDTSSASRAVSEAVARWKLSNNIPMLFMGMTQDFKHFGFCVTVLILSKDRKSVARMVRKEACYCRFSPVLKSGRRYVYYANWRTVPAEKDVEIIEMLDPASPLDDLRERMSQKNSPAKYAIVTRIPTVDSTYYPIPYYAALFRGKWYNIKRLIGVAKEAKLRNSAPVKYMVEVSDKYWESIFANEHITDPKKQMERVSEEKQRILDFLTGAENSGKAWFSTFYRDAYGKEQSYVRITKVDTDKEGGDWASDIVEAINMICFTMRVHSNLVGSVPGKTQTNNSGSDKRELYTIAQALQKPYHDLLFQPFQLLIAVNDWKGCVVDVPFIQLSTLDEHQDAKLVTSNPVQK